MAAAGYGQALAAMPDDQIVAMRAYRQALMAGDYDLASRAAAVLVRAGTAPPDADILAFAIAVHAHDSASADRALARIKAGPLDFLAPVLGAWLALDRGQDPTPLLEGARGNALASRYAERHRALLGIAGKGKGDGKLGLISLLGADPAGDQDLRIDAATLALWSGDRKFAHALLGARYDAIVRIAGKRGKADAAFGASRLFLGLASDIAKENMPSLSILLTRAALLLDPREDRARLYLADALSENGADALAIGVLGDAARGAFADEAAAQRIAVLRRAGRGDDALAGAQALAQRAGATARDAETYGDVLSAQGRFAAAADAYGVALRRADGGGEWKLQLAYGTALDRAGRWSEALPALRRAVELGPDQVEALTYLGYAQTVRGDDPVEATALLERARKIAPEDSGVADSLAWAYFRRGDAARALPLLEQAARSDPAGARVNEHLGDAYWRLGRHYEARYAWRAASLSADADGTKRIEAKLASGLN